MNWPGVSSTTVGSGPDEAALRADAHRLGLGAAVTFEPPQAIRPVLARSRIMVVPSLAESLPYVVLEAAAAGQPLVSTKAGGIPEIFGAASGELVPPRDAAALGVAIARVLDEAPESRDARVAALSAFVRSRFSLTRMGADVLSGYAAAMRTQGRAGRSRCDGSRIDATGTRLVKPSVIGLRQDSGPKREDARQFPEAFDERLRRP